MKLEFYWLDGIHTEHEKRLFVLCTHCYIYIYILWSWSALCVLRTPRISIYTSSKRAGLIFGKRMRIGITTLAMVRWLREFNYKEDKLIPNAEKHTYDGRNEIDLSTRANKPSGRMHYLEKKKRLFKRLSSGAPAKWTPVERHCDSVGLHSSEFSAG